MFGSFLWYMCKIDNKLKSSRILLRFGLITFRFAYGGIQKPSFLWFRDLRTCPGSQNQPFLLLETPGYLNKIKDHPWIVFTSITFIKLENLEMQSFVNFGKDGRPCCWNCLEKRAEKRNVAASNHFLKILDMRSIAMKYMKCKFGKSVKLWNQETLKPTNQETVDPRTEESPNPRLIKSGHQETLESRNQKSKNSYNQETTKTRKWGTTKQRH